MQPEDRPWLSGAPGGGGTPQHQGAGHGGDPQQRDHPGQQRQAANPTDTTASPTRAAGDSIGTPSTASPSESSARTGFSACGCSPPLSEFTGRLDPGAG